MPRLTSIHWKKLDCIFKKAGFVFIRKTGSHRVYEKDGVIRPIIIPTYHDVDRDIIHSIMRTAEMTREQYFDYLSQC